MQPKRSPALSEISALAVPGDVTVKADVDRVVSSAADAFGAIDVLVNNAGILFSTTLADMEEDEWDLVIDVNMKGTYLFSRAVLPYMKQAGWGRIVNFASTAGKAVRHARRSALHRRQGGNPRPNARGRQRSTPHSASPSTPSVQAWSIPRWCKRTSARNASKHISRASRSHASASRGRSPSSVAFLASDRAAYITGASLDINGGDLMIS